MPSIKNISGRNKIDTQKTPKKPNGLAFFKKNLGFYPTLCILDPDPALDPDPSIIKQMLKL